MQTINFYSKKLRPLSPLNVYGNMVFEIDVLEIEVNQKKMGLIHHLMVGRNVSLKLKLPPKDFGDYFFSIDKASALNNKNLLALNELFLKIKRGEIYGIAGVDGNGQNELVEGLIGLRHFFNGKILMNGKDITHFSPLEKYAEKISLIPSDRKKWGLVLDYNIEENLFLRNIDEAPFSHKGIIYFEALQKKAEELIKRFDIRPDNSKTEVKGLSGGNQQKVIIAREVMNEPELLIMFQPTRGLDVGAIEYVYSELLNLRAQNKSILLISYDLDEVIKLSDRIGVIFEGKIIKEFKRTEIDQDLSIKEKIGLCMAGSMN